MLFPISAIRYSSRKSSSRITLKIAGKMPALPTATKPSSAPCYSRLTAEAYLLLDPKAATPRDRWQSLLALHAATHRDAWHRGLEDVHAWLPPSIAKKFGRRLQRLGWIRDDTYTPYCKKLEATK